MLLRLPLGSTRGWCSCIDWTPHLSHRAREALPPISPSWPGGAVHGNHGGSRRDRLGEFPRFAGAPIAWLDRHGAFRTGYCIYHRRTPLDGCYLSIDELPVDRPNHRQPASAARRCDSGCGGPKPRRSIQLAGEFRSRASLRRLSERAPDGALEFRRGLSEPRADDSTAFAGS